MKKKHLITKPYTVSCLIAPKLDSSTRAGLVRPKTSSSPAQVCSSLGLFAGIVCLHNSIGAIESIVTNAVKINCNYILKGL